MGVQVARVIRRPRQVEGVIASRLRGKIIVRQKGRVRQYPEVVPSGHRESVSAGLQPQRLIELPHQQGHLSAVPADHRHLAGLVRRDRDRTACSRKPVLKTRGRLTSNGHRIKRRGLTSHVSDSLARTCQPTTPSCPVIARSPHDTLSPSKPISRELSNYFCFFTSRASREEIR